MTTDRDPSNRLGASDPVELRRRIGEAADRISRLDRERYGLEEVRDGLEARERDVARRLAALEQENRALRREIDARAARATEIAAEVRKLAQETGELERQAEDSALRLGDLSRECDRVAEALRAQLDDHFLAEQRLDAVRDVIARVARKLSAAERGGRC